MLVWGLHERRQIAAAACDHLFVGRHDGLARFEGAPDPAGRGILPADQLDDDVDVGCQHGLELIGPRHAVRYPIDALTFHIAVADIRQLQTFVVACA